MIKILPGLAVALMFPLFYLFLQIAIEMEAPSSTASYTSRALAVAIMGLLFFYSFQNGRLKAKWSMLHLSLLVFMVLYGFRIFTLNDETSWKLDVEHYPFFKVSMLFIFGSIAPFVMAMFSAKLFVLRSTSTTFMSLTFLSVVVVAILNLDQFGVFRTMGYNAGTIASLSMGYLAALAVGFCLLDFLRLKRFPVAIIVFVLVCAVYLLSVSASRGPLLALVISAIYLILTMRKTFANLASSIIGAVGVAAGSWWFFNFSGSGIIDRIDQTDGEEVRLDLYTEAIATIESNILFGKDIVLSNGYWPHNFVLEALMAVGVFGLLFIVPWMFALVKIIVDSKDDDRQWLYLWFLQTTVMNMFTEAIWAGSSLFICLCLVLGGGELTKTRSRSRSKRRRRKRRSSDRVQESFGEIHTK